MSMNVKTAHFKSEGNYKYSFDYPLFENWKVEIKKEEIRYIPGNSLGLKFEYLPSFFFRRIAMKVTSTFWDKAMHNKNGIKYIEIEQEQSGSQLIFYFDGIQIEFLVKKDEKYKNFSGKLIYDTIKNSFNAF